MLGEEDLPQVTPGEDDYPLSQYSWDNEDDDAGSSFRVNALSTPEMGYCVRKSHTVTSAHTVDSINENTAIAVKYVINDIQQVAGQHDAWAPSNLFRHFLAWE